MYKTKYVGIHAARGISNSQYPCTVTHFEYSSMPQVTVCYLLTWVVVIMVSATKSPRMKGNQLNIDYISTYTSLYRFAYSTGEFAASYNVMYYSNIIQN